MNKLDISQTLQTTNDGSMKVPSGILQRKCASCGTHTVAGDKCGECTNKQGALQRKSSNNSAHLEVPPIVREVLNSSGQPLDKSTRAFFESRFSHNFSKVPISSVTPQMSQSVLKIGEPTDDYEQEADRAADSVMRKEQHETKTSSANEQQGGKFDLSRVRVHTGARAAESAQAVNALAYTVGNHIVFNSGQYMPAAAHGKHLLAHELTHVIQQSNQASSPALQRKVIIKGAEMPKKNREAFIKSKKWANKGLAQEIIEDMAVATDVFDFTDERELETEIIKRISTSEHMKESQPPPGETMATTKKEAFGYPFNYPTELYGPRVNYAARDYWEPPVPDAYAVRKDKKKNKQLRDLPRYKRCTVYGDQCGSYSWKLSAKGKADPYSAIKLLFVPQPLHRRTLIHCDYLVSMVNFLSLADSIGATEFNNRVKAFGVDKIILRWNAFNDLQMHYFTTEKFLWFWKKTVKKKALGSLQDVSPSSEADFVIGDHVVFFNYLAYDPLNMNIGNAWRLENAVLIGKKNGKDIFLGHGSGQNSSAGLRAKLAEEFNDVARQALALTRKADSKDAKKSAEGLSEISRKFPKVKKVGSEWRIQGAAGLCTTKTVDEKLKEINGSEVIGPKNPCDTTQMFIVQRPVESAK